MSTKGLTLTDQLIQFSEKAREQVPELQNSNTDWHGKAVRVYLSGKGCDGFEYGVCFADIESDDKIVDEGTFKVIVDPETLKYVRGSVIDWIDDERGKGFLVENPNHKKFRGKFFKKKDWESKLTSGNVH